MLFGKLSLIEISPALAILMDELAVESEGTAKIIQLIRRRKAKEKEAGHRAHEPVRVGRTSGDVDHGRIDPPALEKLLYPLATRRIGGCGWDAPKGRTGPYRQDSQGILSKFDHPVHHGNLSVIPFSNGPVDPALGCGNSSIHDKDIPTFFSGSSLLGHPHR
jgi:hypothetical protein